jgi:hypothetical protein
MLRRLIMTDQHKPAAQTNPGAASQSCQSALTSASLFTDCCVSFPKNQSHPQRNARTIRYFKSNPSPVISRLKMPFFKKHFVLK